MTIFVKNISVIKNIKGNFVFLIPYLIIIIFASIILLMYDKAAVHIFLNSHHNSFFDIFFKYWTHLGHGFFAFFISLLLLFVKYKWAVISAFSNISISLIVQLLKRLVFSENFRPSFYFKYFYEGEFDLYTVPGAEPGMLHSFPSGHAATAFACFFLLSIIVNKNYLKVIFLLSAILVAYSRIYLSWHFLGDTLAGSAIGLVITLIIIYLMSKNNKEWLESNIISKKINM